MHNTHNQSGGVHTIQLCTLVDPGLSCLTTCSLSIGWYPRRHAAARGAAITAGHVCPWPRSMCYDKGRMRHAPHAPGARYHLGHRGEVRWYRTLVGGEFRLFLKIDAVIHGRTFSIIAVLAQATATSNHWQLPTELSNKVIYFHTTQPHAHYMDARQSRPPKQEVRRVRLSSRGRSAR